MKRPFFLCHEHSFFVTNSKEDYFITHFVNVTPIANVASIANSTHIVNVTPIANVASIANCTQIVNAIQIATLSSTDTSTNTDLIEILTLSITHHFVNRLPKEHDTCS